MPTDNETELPFSLNSTLVYERMVAPEQMHLRRRLERVPHSESLFMRYVDEIAPPEGAAHYVTEWLMDRSGAVVSAPGPHVTATVAASSGRRAAHVPMPLIEQLRRRSNSLRGWLSRSSRHLRKWATRHSEWTTVNDQISRLERGQDMPGAARVTMDFRCQHCSTDIVGDVPYFPHGHGHTCQNCVEESGDYFFCEGLGNYVHCEDTTTVNMDNGSERVISQAMAHRFCECEECDERFESTTSIRVNGRTREVCEGCISSSENYFVCDECGGTFHQDDANHDEDSGDVRCNGCQEALELSEIREYSFRPRPQFRGKSTRKNPYIGFELEVENKGSLSTGNLARLVKDDYLYKKSDGSLSNGFEIVSHPATLAVHAKQPYKAIFEALAAKGAKSHETKTCGLHFHLDRRDMTEAHKIRLGMLLAFCHSEFCVLARRGETQYAKYKKPDDGTAIDDYKNRDRYAALNWHNDHTVEFRIYRGTLKYETFMASMELCHAAFTFTHDKDCFGKDMETGEIFKRLLTFVGKRPAKYGHLIEYIKSKNFTLGGA